jgi:GTP cyclohydrolase FolE2
MPLMTHSQRCRTHVKLRGLAGPLNLLEILDSIDRVAVRCQNTMPREFELLTVFLAHARPQFLEDVLRDLSADLAKTLADEADTARIVIDSISMESIHDFDLHGQIDTSLAEVRAISP